MKEPYIFDLLELTENYKEKELENKMLNRIKNVLLELGYGFLFISNQCDVIKYLLSKDELKKHMNFNIK